MTEHFNAIQNAINNKTYDSFLETLRSEISKEEKTLEELIIDNQADLVTNCTIMSDLSLNKSLSPITEKMKDASLSLLLLHKQATENTEIMDKTNIILNNFVTLRSLLEKMNNGDRLYEDCINYQYIYKNIKFFKEYKFYDDLKILFKNKRSEYISKLHERADKWLSHVIDLYKNIGEQVLKGEKIVRDELKLTIVLEPFYIFTKLDMCDEFCEYLNRKRININKHLNITEMIGFLYIEKVLFKINDNFRIHDIHCEFEKKDLVLLIQYLKKYDYDYKKHERALEKICCDYILSSREDVNNKVETEKFYSKVSAFLEDIDLPCVIEIFYKCLDDMILKYFRDEEINEAINRYMSFKNVGFSFRSIEKASEILEQMKKKTDAIFEKGNYEDLKHLILSKDLIEHIKTKFISKLKTTSDIEERKLEAEAVKFHVYLKRIKLECADVFEEVLNLSKSINN